MESFYIGSSRCYYTYSTIKSPVFSVARRCAHRATRHGRESREVSEAL